MAPVGNNDHDSDVDDERYVHCLILKGSQRNRVLLPSENRHTRRVRIFIAEALYHFLVSTRRRSAAAHPAAVVLVSMGDGQFERPQTIGNPIQQQQYRRKEICFFISVYIVSAICPHHEQVRSHGVTTCSKVDE